MRKQISLQKEIAHRKVAIKKLNARLDRLILQSKVLNMKMDGLAATISAAQSELNLLQMGRLTEKQ